MDEDVDLDPGRQQEATHTIKPCWHGWQILPSASEGAAAAAALPSSTSVPRDSFSQTVPPAAFEGEQALFADAGASQYFLLVIARLRPVGRL